MLARLIWLLYKDKDAQQERLSLYWWEKVLARLGWLRWRASVAFLPHSYRHRPDCGHLGKTHMWKASDGCWGTVCLYCLVAARWSPSYMPDVVRVTKLHFPGPDPWAKGESD